MFGLTKARPIVDLRSDDAMCDSNPSIRTTAKSLDFQVGFRVVFGLGLAEAGPGSTATFKFLEVDRIN